ncbi:MAG: 50S ribosomal protein L3 N(5)-glutamine methyltransferase [Gammaproteobacteria bacterium]|nr:50S ribosomal protein L3 N(5)-glutamine methyltransferase [Gammaproteobacteria bacterium]
MTPDELRRRFAARLANASVVFGQGTHDAESDAAALVDGYLLGLGVANDGALPAGAEGELEQLLARRIGDRLPAAHLTGVAWLAGEAWHVPPDVMIPRSPIGEALRGGLSPWLRDEPEAILDLCCGCGCLGLVAANAFPGAEVDLADIDASALAAARTNLAARPHLTERVRIVQGDLFASLGGRRYGLVICNPPYVASAELAEVPAEFRHEPRLGLDGGDDGLTVWRRILAGLAGYVRPNAVLLGEAGGASARFDAAFPHLGAIWLDLPHAEQQADGTYGVFVANVDESLGSAP